MTTVHFIGQEHINGQATGIYHLTIDGNAFTYNRETDILTNAATGRETRRRWLLYSVLKAFYLAWDPDVYAYLGRSITGIPDKPQGEPMELRPDHVTLMV